MSLIDRDLLPVACTLTPGAGAAQLAAWQEFNDDYLLDIDRTAAQITVHYPKIDDATAGNDRHRAILLGHIAAQGRPSPAPAESLKRWACLRGRCRGALCRARS